MNVSIDKEACIGCGICANLCSDTFEMVQDKARVKQEPSGSGESCAREAVTDCPTHAILVQ